MHGMALGTQIDIRPMYSSYIRGWQAIGYDTRRLVHVISKYASVCGRSRCKIMFSLLFLPGGHLLQVYCNCPLISLHKYEPVCIKPAD